MTEFPETRASLLVQLQSPENREAWDEFAATYQPAIYRMARRRGMQDADARDLVQEVLVKVSSAIGQYEKKPGVRFRNWIGRVAKNAIVTTLTRQRPDLGEGGTVAQGHLDNVPDEAEPLRHELDTELMRERFLQAAAVVRTDVNQETWLAFEQTVIQGLSCEAVAQQLGKSIGTVYASRSRVFRRLKDQIALGSGEEQ